MACENEVVPSLYFKKDYEGDASVVKRPCKCLRTSEKLRRILENFPASLPPSSPITNSKFVCNYFLYLFYYIQGTDKHLY